MPISNTSRYFGLSTYDAPDAREVSHPALAIHPFTPPAPGTALYRHLVTGVEDIEYLAWRYYGSSESWWRIAEANELFFPLDLVPGTTLNIPAAGDVGRIVRTRRF